MRTLPRILCTIALLSMSGFVWASCPDGQEENDRTGECVPIKGSAKAKKSLSSGSGWQFKRSLPVGAKRYGHQVVSVPEHPVRYGKKSERFEVRPGDCSRSPGYWDDCKKDRERSELVQRGYTQNSGDEYWYRWSIYIPEGHQNIYPTKLTYGQFHEAGTKPPMFMFDEIFGGYWFVILNPFKDGAVSPGFSPKIELLDAKDFTGKWNDVVVHVRWTRKDDGWIKVWVNGEEKASFDGKTMDSKNVYFKYGVYRSFVSRSELSETVTTIAYYDGVVRSKSRDGMFDPLPE